MIWRSRMRQWVGTAIVIALAGMFWLAVKQAERVGASAAAALGEAMSKAAHQRELSP